MKTELIDFYWVKSVWNDPTQSAFHITVRDKAETMDDIAALEGIAARDRVLNIAQAQTEGFNLTQIGASINADIAAANDLLTKALADAEAAMASPDTAPTFLQSVKNFFTGK